MMDIYQPRLAAFWNAWGIRLVILAFTLLFLHSVYATFLQMHSGFTASKDELAADSGRNVVARRIMDANLFKGASHKSSGAASFELHGTFAGSGDTPSYAIITESGQPEKSYHVGGKLPGGAEVTAIYADHVVVSVGGAQQTLYLKPKH